MSQHHSFDVHLASIYGITEAIILHHITHWIMVNKRLNKNFHEGRTWTYQTFDEITAHFPYLTPEQVRYCIYRLCHGKNPKQDGPKEFEPPLMKGNFNKSTFDRTTWYALVNENLITVRGNPQMEEGNSPNGNGKFPASIPDTKTNTKTEKKKNTLYSSKSPPPDTPLIEFGKYVRLTKQSHENLIQRFGKDRVDEVIEKMNDYCVNNRPKGYKDYEAAIRTWCMKELKQSTSTKSYRNETRRDEINRKHIEEYEKANGSFDDSPNILRFT